MQHGLKINGMNVVLTSTVPIGAGLSSSAAIEVAFGLAWQSIGEWHVDRMSLAQLCQKAENDFVGMNSGLMDQFACLHGVAGCILFFDCRTLDWEAIPLPDGISIVVADTNVRRSLPDSAYNQRRAACEQAVQILKGELPEIQTLRDVSIAELNKYAHLLPNTIHRRAEHIVYECERTLSAVELLRMGDLKGFGAKMIEGHYSLRDLYEVSSPELDALIELATGMPGWYGSRLTGAGFGGCTVHLVDQDYAEDFSKKLSASYHNQTGRQASTWILQAADGANITNLVQSQNNDLVQD
jgi:galactokinase